MKTFQRLIWNSININYSELILQRNRNYLLNNTIGSGFLNFRNITDVAAISDPVRITEINLHPVKTNGLNFAGHFAYVPLWIMAGASVGVILLSSVPLVKAGIRPVWTAAYRVCFGASISLLISLVLSLVLLALGGTFDMGTSSFYQVTLSNPD